ncbi:DUF1569 domain-containing protein [Caenimonas koreensis DSM 17982]|uniref:DUF1569 domain-containing protein n=1 Tax=Caenimonas koreensis DSM 17982 TaxID=1121255 RepID=A0A844AUR2_9BURK|nr:DUF1569 domain-containing protein [Caenimonas koreensis]MRD48250.1 DUF1569 domain-containing protein [Caenimonas koreensis DSM 17982]
MVKAGAASSVVPLAACASNEGLRFSSLAAAQDAVTKLAANGIPKSDTAFSWAQTLNHLAQSIEYSMTGFPESKSRLFQKTAGAAAFQVFAWRGQMTHSLSEPIPGAPALDRGSDPKQGMERLVAAIAAFRNWPGGLKPHFAYGELDKASYELAHAMHIANHVSEFKA